MSVTVETGTVPCPLPHSQYKRFINETKRCFAGLCYLIKQVIGYEKGRCIKMERTRRLRMNERVRIWCGKSCPGGRIDLSDFL